MCLSACRLIRLILERVGTARKLVLWSQAAWLFNPFTATISTRGSGESLVVVMLLGLLLCLLQGDMPRPQL